MCESTQNRKLSCAQVHDTSDTASAGSPANTISSSTSTAPGPSSMAAVTSMGFPQEAKAAVEKLSDVAVVSLVAPTATAAAQPAQANPPTSTREDYDSSATVRPIAPARLALPPPTPS